MIRTLLLTLLLTLPAWAQYRDVGTFQTDPLTCARAYYTAIRYHDYAASYDLCSASRQARLPYPAYVRIWQNNLQCSTLISDLTAVSGNRAMVTARVWARDVNPNGRIVEGDYLVKIYLVREGGLWWVDDTSARAVSY